MGEILYLVQEISLVGTYDEHLSKDVVPSNKRPVIALSAIQTFSSPDAQKYFEACQFFYYAAWRNIFLGIGFFDVRK